MDRRTIWAILLMMAIAIVPASFLEEAKRVRAQAGRRDSGAAGQIARW